MSGATSPPKWMGMIATVSSVMASATDAADRASESRSMSAKTGVPPAATTAFAVAGNVKEGTITSPSVRPWARRFAYNADVPELNATACRVPAASAILRSNSPISGPFAHHVPRWMTSVTAVRRITTYAGNGFMLHFFQAMLDVGRPITFIERYILLLSIIWVIS